MPTKAEKEKIMSKVIINTSREGYATNQVPYTMTVGELIAVLSDLDEDARVYFGNDKQSYGWYTYGGIDESDIFDDYARYMEFGRKDEEDEEEEEE